MLKSLRVPKVRTHLDYVQYARDFQEGGAVALAGGRFRQRPAQEKMACLVGQAIEEQRHLLIEAPTGTGKSLAYLVPGVRSGRQLIVATATRTLQDQLYSKEIAFVQRNIQAVTAAVFKGAANYVCLRRLEELKEQLEAGTEREYQAVRDALEDGWDGDFDKFEGSLDAVRSEIECDRDDCGWRNCPFFEKCYLRAAREQVKSADVVITNHALLAISLASEQANMLPDAPLVVVDEAHQLEGYVRNALGKEITLRRFTSLMNLKLIPGEIKEKFRDLVPAARALWDDFMDRNWGESNQLALVGNSVGDDSPGMALARRVEKLGDELEEYRQMANLEGDKSTRFQGLVRRVERLAESIADVFGDDDGYVRYLEKEQRGRRREWVIKACAQRVSVADFLRNTLFCNPAKRTVVLCSATLAAPDFAAVQRDLGLDGLPVITDILRPTFKYERQALLYIGARLPAPVNEQGENRARYERAIGQVMITLVNTSRGRAFLLFTSRRAMDVVYQQFLDAGMADRYQLLKQGDLPTGQLVKRFREERSPVLFGLKSFWEGISIEGDQLSLVVIDKLPFPSPSVLSRAIEKQLGEQSFRGYLLPAAILALKQGVGRLIRTETDSGVMAILDSRISSKPYGRDVLRALPPARQTTSLADVEQFFINGGIQ